MSLQGKTVGILVENVYEDLELHYPRVRLTEEGAEVKLIGPRAGEVYTSKHGVPVKADVPANETSVIDYDAIIIPGGFAPDYMRRHPAMVELVKESARAGKIVAAICHAGWMLASADIVRGRQVTGFFSIKDDMVNAGATWLDREVVRDGNIITSRNPTDLPAFCRAIISALSE